MTFEPLTNLEIDTVLHLLPAAVQAQLQRENVVLAGGVIRDTVAGLPVKDIDIFCHSEEQAERLAREVSTFVQHTLFAYSVNLGIPIQYVYYKDFTDARDLVSQFDFRACCAGLYWDEAFGLGANLGSSWRGVAVEGFHADCAERQLRFMSQPKDNGKLTALGRALRLAKKGWTLSTDEAASIIEHWQGRWEGEAIMPPADLTARRERIRCAFRPGYR